MIAKAGRDLGLNRVSALLAATAYGVNPVADYYAANGMSESCEFFFLAVSLWGLLRYLRAAGPAVRCCRGWGWPSWRCRSTRPSLSSW